MVTVRELEKTENQLTKEFFEKCCPEKKGKFSDFFYDYRAEKCTIIAAEDTSRSASAKGSPFRAMIAVDPVNVRIFSTRCDVPYIALTVCGESGEELFGKMLTLTLNVLSDRKQPFTFVMPDDEKKYEDFGFRRGWSFRWENDICDDRSGGIDRLIWLCDDAIVEELCRNVNRRLAQLYDVFSYRTVRYYRELDYEQKALGGEVRIIFDHHEMPISGECMYRGNYPDYMMRITDFAGYIGLVHAQQPDHFLWRISDPLIRDNNGIFDVTLGRSESRAVRVSGEELQKRGDVEITDVPISEVPQLLGQEDPLSRCCVSELV